MAIRPSGGRSPKQLTRKQRRRDVERRTGEKPTIYLTWENDVRVVNDASSVDATAVAGNAHVETRCDRIRAFNINASILALTHLSSRRRES